jgi:hypothetical protein
MRTKLGILMCGAQGRRGEKMKRRDFVASTAAAGLAGIVTRQVRADASAGDSIAVEVPGVPGRQSNILVIMVDQMRYPSVFPSGINDAGTFLSRIMPNVHKL